MTATTIWPEPKSVEFITIEILQNGFLASVPEKNGIDRKRWSFGTINGLVKFIEHTCGSKYIVHNDNLIPVKKKENNKSGKQARKSTET